MKLCHFDPFSGIAGDMTVGALVDAGADWNALHEALTSLNLGATYELDRVKRKGISAAKFRVSGGETKAHRHLPQVERIIANSGLSARAKEAAVNVFRKLGEAEAKTHGVPIEKVHFHEVGAVDSISDICGAAAAFDLLGVEKISCSAINTGSGTVKAEHGVMPVPAPATARLLTGIPIYARGPEIELTTPTGAAIVAALASHFGAMPAARIVSTGYGAGDKEFPEHANVLRAVIAEISSASESTQVSVIEANIDDSTPEVLGYAVERLLELGALDAACQPLQMKKNRPAVLLTVIARPEDQERLAEAVFAETSTIGLRVYTAERRVRERQWQEVDLGYGKVRVKIAGVGQVSPEFEDCRTLARESGRALKQVMADAMAAYFRA